MSDRERTQVRLLPWSGEHGGPCVLVTDGDGPVSRIADRVESGGPGLVDGLLSRARGVLAGEEAERCGGELAFADVQLVDVLLGALLVGAFDDARPGASGFVAPQGVGFRAFGLLSLPGTDLASAGAARRYACDMARSWRLPSDAVADLESVVGELAANALEHGGSDLITVTLALATATVTIAVTDAGPSRGIAASLPTAWVLPGVEQERGRGLLITEALASRWGRWGTRDSLTVWADIAVESAWADPIPGAVPPSASARRDSSTTS
ncbi:ATP-binding protein [Streptomyces sp. NBC_00487]|uniref:ATP-binding protein n=1 Tax=unclassified Streptomyces TaxID=2593676 RepID=UPI002DD9FC8B|nr:MULTISPECIES: ATP-binding protein [unclassified Streptomyces]WRY97926.1 ATP-binding protein [Streptomyces sp. NBC_00481]